MTGYLKLKILNGTLAGTTLEVNQSPTWLGSEERCEVCIPEAGVSGVHAVLKWDYDRWVFEDAGGSFGSLLNGNDLQQDVLQNGDLLTLGWIRLRVIDEAGHADYEDVDEPTQFAAVAPVDHSLAGVSLEALEELEDEESDFSNDTIPPTSLADLIGPVSTPSREDSTQLADSNQLQRIYQEEIQRLQETSSNQALEVDRWKEEAHRAMEELALRQDELSQLETQMAVLEDEVQQLQTHHAVLEDELQQLQTQLALAQDASASGSSDPALSEQMESLQSTLNLYYEENERLQMQVSIYEEAAEANETLMEDNEKLQETIHLIQHENDHLKTKLREFWQLLHQHGLLPGK